MSQDEIIAFIRQSIGSVYAIELLLLIMRHASRRWQAGDLVRELRSSGTAVAEALGRLSQAGMISEDPEGCYAFVPASARHAEIAVAIQKLYVGTPISVMRAIVAVPQSVPGR